MKKFLFIFCGFVLISFAQKSDEIDLKNSELENIRKEILALESELKNLSKDEKESVDLLDKLSKRNMLIGKLIFTLQNQEVQKQKEIAGVENTIKSIEAEIKGLKEVYSKYIRWVYKRSSSEDLKFILDSESINQALNRYKYLKSISRKNELVLGRLREQSAVLASSKKKLGKDLLIQQHLLEERKKESDTLRLKRDERERVLSAIKREKIKLTDGLEKKRQAEIEIKLIVARLVEEARRKEVELRTKKAKDKNFVIPEKYNYNNLADFSELEGKMLWPVASGRVIRKFGEELNERLNTITINYGIDISTQQYMPVKAVAEGIVSAIEWLPGFGSVIIITHKGDFRTVYGHIAEISVKEGDKIPAGTEIGKVNSSLEGNILHFEIWKDRNYQNPEQWLVRK